MLSVATLLTTAALPAIAHAASGEEIYKGKTITVVIGYSVGGGYDMYGRLVARHMGKYMPGRPNFLPQNMPGAGSVKSLEWLINMAPKDGMVMATFGRTLPLSPLIEGAKYDVSNVQWIGSVAADTSACIAWSDAGVTTMEDLRNKEIPVAGLAKGSDPDIFTGVARNALGAKMKLVTGYPGSRDMAMALERGEVKGICGYTVSSIRSNHQEWLRNKRIVYLAQMGLERDKELPNVPLMHELAKSKQQRDAIELISLSQTVARPFAAPPGTPPERVAILRKAFMETMNDPEFLAEARQMKLEVSPMSGEKMTELIRRAYASPREVVNEAIRLIGD
jgi:tripartite-type tricarboxylate transporter receptor subunit TctC